MPLARARSIRAVTSCMWPQCERPTFRCQISTGIAAARAMANASSSASKILEPSLRKCVA